MCITLLTWFYTLIRNTLAAKKMLNNLLFFENKTCNFYTTCGKIISLLNITDVKWKKM